MPASPSTARAINDRLALSLLQQQGPLTAGQLKQLTGLSRPTVADLVERLAASGLIAVVGESGEQRRGPNARLYGIVADRAHLAALDVRTDSVSVLVSDLVGRVLAEGTVPVGPEEGTTAAVEQAVALVERTVKEAEASGGGRLHTVGIGAPGLIDPATCELRDSAGLPAWHRRLVAALQERFPEARVSVENETNLAALAEQREGVARDRDTFVLLWLGDGCGAAVVLDGSLRRGASGGTGEIGFLPVPGTEALPSATDCSGGYHSLVGAAAITRLAEQCGLPPSETAAQAVAQATRTTPDPPAPLETTGTPAEPRRGAGNGAAGHDAPAADDGLSRPRLEADGGSAEPRRGAENGAAGHDAPAADDGLSRPRLEADGGSAEPRRGAGDGVAGHDVAAVGRRAASGPSGDRSGRFLDALADRIAVGVAAVVAVLDPGCVVLGGEIGPAGGAVLAERVEARLRLMSPLATEVRASTLGGAAVLRGALLTARERAQDDLFAPPGR
ncbi:ROK family transcriptional regulator [Streptomyces humi]|uniref:ROK family transcriptional regulator n=1 Tax=Streptomyces humi TaxID=1428620 RepID=UPI00062874D9|nr:ROK family transcriptional regulator [Streptomyces humi]